MEENRKRKHLEEREDENAPKIPAFSDDDDVDELEIEEEMVVAVMKRLEQEISFPSPSPSSSSPSLSASSFSDLARGSRGFVNGGNEESCGSSFSDSASTVMASVDTTCRGCWPADPAAAWPWIVGSSEVGSSVGSDVEEGEEDEEWLARVLDGPGFDLEECFSLD